MQCSGRAVVMGAVLLGQLLVATGALAALSISPSPSTGSYTVSWTAPAAQVSTKLHERVGSGTWSVVGTYSVDRELEGVQRQGGGHVQLQDEAVFHRVWQAGLWGFGGPGECYGECRADAGPDGVYQLEPVDGGLRWVFDLELEFHECDGLHAGRGDARDAPAVGWRPTGRRRRRAGCIARDPGARRTRTAPR